MPFLILFDHKYCAVEGGVDSSDLVGRIEASVKPTNS